MPEGNREGTREEALLRHLVLPLLQQPDRLQIRLLARGGDPLLELRVAEADFPRVVGRQGRTARALRTVVQAAYQGPARLGLNIVDPEDDGGPV